MESKDQWISNATSLFFLHVEQLQSNFQQTLSELDD